VRSGPDWLILLETLGIISFAINAMIVARGKEVSTFGIFLCAAVTALGGGTLRDILLGPAALPLFWVAFPFYIVAIFVLSVGYAYLEPARQMIARRDYWIKESAESLAYASLGSLGAAKAFNILSATVAPGLLGQSQLVILCAFFAAVSVAFGGIMRDVILNQFPGALKPGSQVIESLFLGGAVLVILRLTGVEAAVALLAGFVIILTFRLMTIWTKQPRAANGGKQ
jgi:uncharacterized membrane protein YeiH